jgi:hypothetical protein
VAFRPAAEQGLHVRITDRCEFRGRQAGAAVVVCPPGLDDDALRRAGRAACRGERNCTAWFWEDPALAPEAPPTPERPMSEAQADAAVAVYIAELDRLRRAAGDERGSPGRQNGFPPCTSL